MVRPHQLHPRRTHHHHRRPHRISASRQEGLRQPARSGSGYAVILRLHCALPCVRIPTSSWSAKCETSKPSALRCTPRKPATWCSPRCTPWTRSKPSTVLSLIFPPPEQKQVRLQLAAVLRAVISQRLVRRCDGDGRVPAVEVMINTAYIRECILVPEKTRVRPRRYLRPELRSTACRPSISRYGICSRQD